MFVYTILKKRKEKITYDVQRTPEKSKIGFLDWVVSEGQQFIHYDSLRKKQGGRERERQYVCFEGRLFENDRCVNPLLTLRPMVKIYSKYRVIQGLWNRISGE